MTPPPEGTRSLSNPISETEDGRGGWETWADLARAIVATRHRAAGRRPRNRVAGMRRVGPRSD